MRLETHARSKLVNSFITAIQERPIFTNSQIIILTENNYGLSGADVFSDVTGMLHRNVTIVREEKNMEKVGVCTTNHVKKAAEEMCRAFIEQDTIVILNDYINANPFKQNRAESVLLAKLTLKKQLKQMRRLVKQSESSSRDPTIIISGKYDSNGRFCGEKDDVAICFLLGVYWMDRWFRYAKVNGHVIGLGEDKSIGNNNFLQRKRKQQNAF